MKEQDAARRVLGMVHSMIAISLMLLALAGRAYGASGIILVDRGKPTATVIVTKDASRTVRFAARELREYLEKMTGARLPIETVASAHGRMPEAGRSYVLVGQSAYMKELGIRPEALQPDGFVVVATGNCLALVGRDYGGDPMFGMRHPFTLGSTYNRETGISVYGETGTLFAVYHFLESLGVRWYMPGELGEVVPQRASIAVRPTRVEKAPAFEYRYVYFGPFRSDPEKAKWFKRAGYGARFPVSINHSFLFFTKYQAAHPEYFALIDGARDLDRTCQGKGSLCLCEPTTLRQMASDAKRYFREHPWARIYPVMPNDSYQRQCECARCRARADRATNADGGLSDYVWGFVNRVADQVRRDHPGKLIACAAYGTYSAPPKRVGKLAPNVAVMIAKKRHSYWSAAYRERIQDTVERWSKRTGNIYVWEYYNWNDRARKYYRFLDDWGYSLLGLPVLFPHVTQHDLRHSLGSGVKGEFIEVDRFGWPGLLHLPIYVTGKLLWDPDRDVDDLLDDYCTRFYGRAAGTMRAFLARSEEIWTEPVPGAPAVFKGGAPDRLKGRAYTGEVVDELRGYLIKARQEADGVCRDRIDMLIEETSPMLRLKALPRAR